VDSSDRSRRHEELVKLNSRKRSHAARVAFRRKVKDANFVPSTVWNTPKSKTFDVTSECHSSERLSHNSSLILKWRVYSGPSSTEQMGLDFHDEHMPMKHPNQVFEQGDVDHDHKATFSWTPAISPVLSIVPHKFPGDLKNSVQFRKSTMTLHCGPKKARTAG
jgi:hypothetical protein